MTVRHYAQHIAGQEVEASEGSLIERRCPTNDETIAMFAKGSAQDARPAVETARSAFDDGP